MRWLLGKVASFSTWGLIFLMMFTIGFNINLADIISLVHNGTPNLNYICLYLVFSPLLTIVFSVLASIGSKEGFFYSLFRRNWTLLRCPWGGIVDIIVRQKYKDTEIDFGDDTPSELTLALGNLFKTIIWWVVFLYCVYTIRATPNNAIFEALRAFSIPDLFKTLAIMIIIYVAIYFVVKGVAISLIRSRYNNYSNQK